MKKIKLVALAILVSATAISCNKKSDKKETSTNVPVMRTNGLKIAYYNQDSLLEHFNYYKEMDSLVKKKQIKFQNELASREKALKSYIETNGKRAQAGQLSQNEIESIQMEAQRREQAFYQYQQTEGAKLEQETLDLLEVIGKKIEAAGKKYSEENEIDMLMIKSKGSQFNYINESMNVTRQFTEFVNDFQQEIEKDAGKK